MVDINYSFDQIEGQWLSAETKDKALQRIAIEGNQKRKTHFWIHDSDGNEVIYNIKVSAELV